MKKLLKLVRVFGEAAFTAGAYESSSAQEKSVIAQNSYKDILAFLTDYKLIKKGK